VKAFPWEPHDGKAARRAVKGLYSVQIAAWTFVLAAIVAAT
jgi:hypothetical protein